MLWSFECYFLTLPAEVIFSHLSVHSQRRVPQSMVLSQGNNQVPGPFLREVPQSLVLSRGGGTPVISQDRRTLPLDRDSPLPGHDTPHVGCASGGMLLVRSHGTFLWFNNPFQFQMICGKLSSDLPSFTMFPAINIMKIR